MRQYAREIMITVIILAALICMVTCASGDETYYMPDDGSTLHNCFAIMSGGDTLIIRDGVYTGDANTMDHSHRPPDGSPEAYTIIKAENTGKAIFDCEGVRVPVDVDCVSYITYDGIIFKNSSGTVFDITHSDHIKILRCGMGEAYNDESIRGSSLFFRYVDYGLIEDTFIWGGFRYGFYMLDSDHLVLRRCVARQDRGIAAGWSNMGTFRVYSSCNTSLQNCITIDGDQIDHYLQNSNSGLVPAVPKAFWPGGANGRTDNVHIIGTVSLNNRGMLSYILSPQWDPVDNRVENSVFWGAKNGLWSRVERHESVEMSHLTICEIEDGYGLRGEYGNGVKASDNLLYGIGLDSDDYAMLWTDNPVNSSDYNVLYSNKNNYCTQHGAHPGLHDLCSENGNAIDPLNGSPGSDIPSLRYLPRIEDGSDLDCVASDGGDIGATILYRIGRDGTLWGEEGYDEMTDEPLWPFPNEDMIKEQRKTYLYDNGNIRGDRGFCADGTGLYGGPITLTSYIWEYLGSPCPPEICNCSAQNDICGDLDGDGNVTSTDALIVLETATDSRPNDPAADLSGDGEVTSLDALMILKATG